jgi:hypothetical protein
MAAPAQALQQQPQQQPQQKKFFGAPTAKVGTGPLAGAIMTLGIVLIKAKWPNLGQQLTAELGGAVTTMLTFILQYLVPERS